MKLYEIVDEDGKSVFPFAYHNREEAEGKLLELKKDDMNLKIKEFDIRMDYEG